MTQKKTHKKKGKLITGLTGVMLIAGTLWLGQIIVDGVMSGSYFVVKQINVKGIVNADTKRVEQSAKNLIGKNIFDIDSAYLETSGDQWVERVEIRKNYPQAVDIIVYEQRSVVKMATNDKKCWHVTAGAKLIPAECSGVSVEMKEEVSDMDFAEFLKMYEDNAVLHNKKIVLKRSHFSVMDEGAELMISYNSSMFLEQYEAYIGRVKKRYSSVSYADLRIEGKIFVNGVLNAG